jgi:hypothetical protein
MVKRYNRLLVAFHVLTDVLAGMAAFLLAYGPPPPWPADNTGGLRELQRAFYAFARDVEFLKGVEIQHIWNDFLWVARNGALENWKPEVLTPTIDPPTLGPDGL